MPVVAVVVDAQVFTYDRDSWRAHFCGRRKSKVDGMPNIDAIRWNKSGHTLAWDTGHSQYCAADGRGLGLLRATEKQDEARALAEVLCDYSALA